MYERKKAEGKVTLFEPVLEQGLSKHGEVAIPAEGRTGPSVMPSAGG